ncbi:MAG: hypothetical protein QXY75_07080 [Candidatus Bathyarchaeia archaeon]
MKLLKSRKGLSTVVTTLIILVVSVLLASVVTFYAINVTTTRVQEESLFLTKPHVWVNGSSSPTQYMGAIMIINTGGRDVALDKISVRGQECPWENVYYTTTKEGISADLPYVWIPEGAVKGNITIGNRNYTFTKAGGDLTLKSGYTMIIYIRYPDSISINDIGITVGITVFTSSAQYYKEVNVEAVEASDKNIATWTPIP